MYTASTRGLRPHSDSMFENSCYAVARWPAEQTGYASSYRLQSMNDCVSVDSSLTDRAGSKQ